jgi:hypothetical protein
VPTYRLYGRNVSVETPLVTPVPAGPAGPAGPVDLRVESLPEGELRHFLKASEPFFRSEPLVSGEEIWLAAYRDGERLVLRFSDAVDFLIEPGRIGFSLGREGNPRVAETYLLGIVLALWLERSGSLCLHASAVNTPSQAVGFLGFNRAGKSSLAASFLAAGIPLLTDDVLALELDERGRVVAQPGFPQLRLWPASAEELVEKAHQLEPVHPDFDKRRVPVGGAGLGSFHEAAAEVRALMLPDRKGTEIVLTRLTPREAAIELVRHSFLGALGEAALGVDRRFERLVAVAERVPVFRLTYPNGLEHLPAVRGAILERLSAL